MAFAALLALSVACAKPRPPTVTPQMARVERVSPQGLGLRLTLRVANPNAYPLAARSVRGTLFLRGARLGTGQSVLDQWIAAEKAATVEAQVQVAWADLPALAPLLGQPRVPYTFQGHVTVGGESLNVELPFELEGQLEASQLIAAGLRGLPNFVKPQYQ